MPPIDLEYIRKQVYENICLQRDLLFMFDRQIQEIAQEITPILKQGIPPASIQKYTDLLHKLRGSSLAIGAFPLAKALETLEKRLAMPSSSQRIAQASQEVIVRMAEVRAFVQAHLIHLESKA